MRQVAVELEVHTRRAQLLFQWVDRRNREELILRGPVAEQRCLDLRGVDELQRRVAVPDHARIGFRHQAHRQQRQRTAHAKPGDAHLGRAPFEILHCATHVL
jgi:hypothetical protein